MDPQTVQEIKPLVIRTAGGDIIDVSLMNPKCRSKSIERNQLWHLHRETGRTLPYDERYELQELKTRGNWYEAVISLFDKGNSGHTSVPTESAGQTHTAQPHPRQPPAGRPTTNQSDFNQTGAPQPPANLSNPGRNMQREAWETPQEPEIGGDMPQQTCGGVLESLEAIVRERRVTMPEGSYTTHLFSSGAEKIRKKAGEEAVELILADSRGQIVYEAADLLFHLCVLLVSEDISYNEVCTELHRRHAQE